MEAIRRPKIPEVRKVNYEHFKNRYDEDKPDYAIEVLVGPLNLHSQIRDERMRRKEMNLSAQRNFPMLAAYQLMEEALQQVADNSSASKGFGGAIEAGMSGTINETYTHRIRIHSQPILGYLTQLLGENEGVVHRSWARTFFRPFRPLIYFQPKMKEILAHLEEKWEATEAAESRDDRLAVKPENDSGIDLSSQAEDHHEESYAKSISGSSLTSVVSKDESPSRIMDKVMDSTEALRDMRCYVAFVDREIMPRYKLLQGNEPQKVSFDELWSLFRVGELVYTPVTGNNTDGQSQELWRLYHVLCPDPKPDWSDTGDSHNFGAAQDDLLVDVGSTFAVYCYHIDHDGSSYGAVRQDALQEPSAFKGSLERAADPQCLPDSIWSRTLPLCQGCQRGHGKKNRTAFCSSPGQHLIREGPARNPEL